MTTERLLFRTLRADEIECRVGTVKENGISILLYKDARCDMNILDESVGPFNWKRSHSRDNANCTVSIWDSSKKEWVSKEDTGTESNTEKEKGLASDSFKRACFNWGIGRELYTAPFIWISGKTADIKYERYSVRSIEYDDSRKITELTIVDKNGVVAFQTGKKTEKKPTKKKVETIQEDEPAGTPSHLLFAQATCRRHNLKFEKEATARGMNPAKLTASDIDRLALELAKWSFENNCNRLKRGKPRAMEYFGITEDSTIEEWITATKRIQNIL